jgi:hypothetical protein
MTTRALLRWLLLVQAACAAGFAWAFAGSGAIASWPLAAFAGLGTVLLVRVLITANNFAMTARFASITPDRFQLGPLARLRLFSEEFMATLLQSSWFMARGCAHESIYDDAPMPPILLIHGYGCNSGYWSQLRPLLDAAHISHAALDLEPMLGAIDDFVPLVADAVAALCSKSNAPKVVIVAHSMGGLVARAYLLHARYPAPWHLAGQSGHRTQCSTDAARSGRRRRPGKRVVARFGRCRKRRNAGADYLLLYAP